MQPERSRSAVIPLQIGNFHASPRRRQSPPPWPCSAAAAAHFPSLGQEAAEMEGGQACLPSPPPHESAHSGGPWGVVVIATARPMPTTLLVASPGREEARQGQAFTPQQTGPGSPTTVAQPGPSQSCGRRSQRAETAAGGKPFGHFCGLKPLGGYGGLCPVLEL